MTSHLPDLRIGSAPSGTDPYVPGHGDASYAVSHYDLDLTYRPAGNRLAGEAVLTCRAASDLDAFDLDLHALEADKVVVEGHPVARFSLRQGRLRVRLREPVAEGEDFVVRVKYSGNPRPVRMRHLGDAGWEELTDGVIVAGQPHGAPSWFPCNDRPDDKASYLIRVMVPAEYHVAGNGIAPEPERRGANRTWVLEMPEPMAPYLATLQIGHYRVLEQQGSVPLHVVAPADVTAQDIEGGFGRQPEMLACFEEAFGRYPFASYVAVITDDDLEIPLESQGLSTFGRNFVSAEWRHERLVAHEMAHQWFGNAVTLTAWRDIWLHEGFACYSEWLWSESSGRDSAATWAAHHHERLAASPQDLLLADPGPDLMFDDRVYKRGALTLHALRTRVGDHVFFAILRSWVAENTGGNVSTELFEAHCASAVWEPVTDLFDAWVRAEELPDLP